MHRRSTLALLLGACAAGATGAAWADSASRNELVATVRGVLSMPDRRLDYLNAKLAFDGLIELAAGSSPVRSGIDALTVVAHTLAGGQPDDAQVIGGANAHLSGGRLERQSTVRV